jgi:flavin reductase (DIM6/NTAB) family NADH-FMN oxidoreductase RutF
MKPLARNEAITLASPYPYVLATVLDPQDRANAIGLCWWTFTSWEPLRLAIAVGHRRYSHECLDHCGEFVLNFPTAAQARGAWLCGNRSGRHGDKLAATGFSLVPSVAVRPPTLDGVTVAFECRIDGKVESGDHTLYLGQVVSMRGNPDHPAHLYSIHYEKLISLDYEGNADFALVFE